MIIKIKQSSDIPYSEVTPERFYHSRRDFIRTATAGLVGTAAAGALAGGGGPFSGDAVGAFQAPVADLKSTRNAAFVAADKPNTFEELTTYNNYYEFGDQKADPGKYAGRLKTKPWTVKVDGLCDKPGNYGVEDLVNFNALEERVYRHRCVERWSMVMPWIGVSLSAVLTKLEPRPSAKFVSFETLVRPSEMPGLSTSNLRWPYVEGLRMDEAMHPLTMMVVGLYGKVLPNPTGAPLRVHIPWKYGFKSGKSIVRISFLDKMPNTAWAVQAPNEYGFYANVNPGVHHPRWSQAREVRLPGLFMNTPTQLFNGYGDQVASLYAGMDLAKNY
jgi:sulfoxide reductase catalytic subunit YedY